MEIMTPENIKEKQERFKKNIIRYDGEEAYNKIVSGEDQRFQIRMTTETYCINLLYEDAVYQFRFVDKDDHSFAMASIFFTFEDLCN